MILRMSNLQLENLTVFFFSSFCHYNYTVHTPLGVMPRELKFLEKITIVVW